MEHILSWLIWLPIIGMVVIVLIPRSQEDIIKKVAAVFTGVQFLFSIVFTFMNVVGVSQNFGHMIVPSFRSETDTWTHCVSYYH